jgi:uncharacterized ferritin-like protein (DUF455 family)
MPIVPNDFRALLVVIASLGFDYGIFVSHNGFTATVYEESKKSIVRIDLVSIDDLVLLSKAID